MANKAKRPTAAQQVADRRQRVAAMRAQEKARDRRRRLVFGGGSGVVAAVLVVVLILVATHKSTPASQKPGDPTKETLPAAITSGQVTTEPAAKTTADDSGISGVTAYVTTGWPTSSNNGAKADALPHNHVEGPVTYSVTPPVGGDHNAQWMNCGVYAQPVPNERAVHNLEHGAIWITYKPSLSAADVSTLRSFVLKQATVKIQGTDTGARYMDLTPWKDDTLPANIVMSAWGHQLKLDSATDPRMQQFVDTFRASAKYTPEFGGACNGTDPSVGGKPFEGQ